MHLAVLVRVLAEIFCSVDLLEFFRHCKFPACLVVLLHHSVQRGEPVVFHCIGRGVAHNLAVGKPHSEVGVRVGRLSFLPLEIARSPGFAALGQLLAVFCFCGPETEVFA